MQSCHMVHTTLQSTLIIIVKKIWQKNIKSLQHLIYYYEFGLKCSELSSKGMGQLWSYNTIFK